jgi:hypothetical protein
MGHGIAAMLTGSRFERLTGRDRWKAFDGRLP